MIFFFCAAKIKNATQEFRNCAVPTAQVKEAINLAQTDDGLCRSMMFLIYYLRAMPHKHAWGHVAVQRRAAQALGCLVTQGRLRGGDELSDPRQFGREDINT
jgi:hypothetical protein